MTAGATRGTDSPVDDATAPVRDHCRFATDGGEPPADPEWTQLAQRHHEPGTAGELATDIVYTIADAAGVDPTEVRDPKLYEVVDVGALNAMFFGPGIEPDDDTGSVEFPYKEYLVQVQRDGWIRVFEPTPPEP